MEWIATLGFGYTLRCLHVINYTQSVFQTNETSRSPLFPLFVAVASASIGCTAVVSFLIVIRYACIQSACSASYGTQTVDLEAKTKGRNKKKSNRVFACERKQIYICRVATATYECQLFYFGRSFVYCFNANGHSINIQDRGFARCLFFLIVSWKFCDIKKEIFCLTKIVALDYFGPLFYYFKSKVQ